MFTNRKSNLLNVSLIVVVILSFPIVYASIDYFKEHTFLFQDKSEADQYKNGDTIRIQIGFVGDIMAHMTQLEAQKINDSTYDFNNNYRWISSYFHANDLMIGNLETTFAGKELGYSAYPQFNTPDDLADALKNAGFDILSTANNHMYDKSTHGLMRTIDILNDRKIPFTGSRKSIEEKKYLIYNVKGVKIGVIAYTYESGRYGDTVTINGLRIKKEDTPLINSFDPHNLSETTELMRNDHERMKKEGAQFFITVIHWGYEYKSYPSEYQVALADSMNKIGVDVIFGSHPHVVQPVDYLYDTLTKQSTFVVYSAGNFISNQRFETLQNYSTEDGLYVEVELQKILKGPVTRSNVTLHPTWVNRYQVEGKYKYEVVPLYPILSSDSLKNTFTPEQIERMEGSFTRTKNLTQKKTSEE